MRVCTHNGHKDLLKKCVPYNAWHGIKEAIHSTCSISLRFRVPPLSSHTIIWRCVPSQCLPAVLLASCELLLTAQWGRLWLIGCSL